MISKMWFLLGFLLVVSGGTSVIAQVNAEFEADVTQGCGSLSVDFSDLSTATTGTIISWSWDLDGAMSSNQNPSRIYNMPGMYTICLTVMTDQGETDTECKTGYIQVFNNPTANFDVDVTSGCGPLTVNFQDLSTIGDGNIVQWIWDLGGDAGVIVDDGSLGNIESTYTIADIYTVSLTVIDEYGCTDNVTLTDIIEVFPDPVIDISSDQNFACTAPLTVTFGNDAIDPNVTYTWDFGNGDPIFNGANPPSVNYTSTGAFDIVITATNTVTGCSTTTTLQDYVSIGQGVLFDFSPDTACLGEEIVFTDLTQTPANTINWDFGDTNTAMNSGVVAHTYTTTGCFTVTLTRDANGCQTVSQAEVCVVDEPMAHLL